MGNGGSKVKYDDVQSQTSGTARRGPRLLEYERQTLPGETAVDARDQRDDVPGRLSWK